MGVERLRERDRAKADEIECWLEEELTTMRILAMDAACFRSWARLMSGKSPTVAQDAMIAATALVHGFTVVTRNTKDFLDFRVSLLDPFAPP